MADEHLVTPAPSLGNGNLALAWPAACTSDGLLPGDGPLARLRATLPGLSGTARACGESVLVNPWAVRGLSIGQMAARVSVSDNAVNRFSRTLGYRGYRDFSQALAMELGRMLGASDAVSEGIASGNTPEAQTHTQKTAASSVVMKVLVQQLESLQDMVRTLDREAVDRAVAAVVAAGTVLFVGTGTGMSIGEVAAYRLKCMGLRAAWAGEPGNILPEIHLLRPGDVVCAISHHGVTHHVVNALDHARERGLTTICVTAVPASPAAQSADILLRAIGPHVGVELGQFDSRMTAVALLEALVAGVAWVTREATAQHMATLIEATQRRNTVAGRRRRREG